MSLDDRLVAGFLASVPDSVYFKDKDSRYLAVSDSVLRHHGLHSRTDILGRTDFELYAIGHAGLSLIDEQRIIRTGEPVLNQLEKLEWTDGRVSWIVSTQLPLRGPDGGIIGIFGVDKDVTAEKEAEAALEKTRQTLAEASRLAGRAEVATGVIHNVGNVLNSLNVSASLIAAALRQSKTASLLRVADLVRQQPGPLADFLARDPKGRLVPNFLISLGRQLAEERALLFRELRSLRSNLDHIRELVLGQQQQAADGETSEPHAAKTLLEDALRMAAASLTRDGVMIVRHYAPAPPVLTQRGKVLQILLNLIRNAHEAVNESEGGARSPKAPSYRPKRITLAIAASEPNRVRLTVTDNGIGIPAENLARLFGHGFTTRSGGHGFGLHASIQAARDLGGSLTAASAGPGQGASFTLTLPAPRTPPDPACPTPAAELLPQE
jgi:PAS domain S-box-containing protein